MLDRTSQQEVWVLRGGYNLLYTVLWLAGQFKKKGGNIFRPRSSRDNILESIQLNDGVSKRVHKPAFGTVICFGSTDSTELLHIYATLYIDT